MEKIGALLIFLFLGLSLNGQSEYFKTGESGVVTFLEYGQFISSNTRFSNINKVKAGSANFGYGWGGKGEFGFGVGASVQNSNPDLIAGLHVGYNVIPKVEKAGLKLESDWSFSQNGNKTWTKGATVFGILGEGESVRIIPSISLFSLEGVSFGSAAVRFVFGSGVLNFTVSPSLTFALEEKFFAIGIGMMGINNKRVVTPQTSI